MRHLGTVIIIFIIGSGWCWAQQDNNESGFSSVGGSFGVDITSRYIFRGITLSNGVNVQPCGGLTYSAGKMNFETGLWGSYSWIGDYTEQDIYVTAGTALGSAGEIYIMATNYYAYTLTPANMADYSAATGPNVIETAVGFAGEDIPFSFLFAANVNESAVDDQHSMYAEGEYAHLFKSGTSIAFTLGAALNESSPGWYDTDGAALINVMLSAGRDIQISEVYTVPVQFSYVLNPDAQTHAAYFAVTLF